MNTKVTVKRISINVREAFENHISSLIKYTFDDAKRSHSLFGFEEIAYDTKNDPEVLKSVAVIEREAALWRNKLELSNAEPVLIKVFDEGVLVNIWQLFNIRELFDERGCKLFLFKNNIYTAEGAFSIEELSLFVRKEFDNEQTFFKQLKKEHVDSKPSPPKPHRERIPEKIRIEVWRRDDRKCSTCGSKERLEYDHIIPVSEGGSNTARNIELLCEKCNRAKGSKIK